MSNTTNTPIPAPQSLDEAFNLFAESYGDPSRPEPTLADFNDSFEDSSESDDDAIIPTEPQDAEITPSEPQSPQVSTQTTPVSSSVDYKELYEKTQKDLRDQAGLYASRFESLTQQYHELKDKLKAAEDAPAKKEPEKMPANVQELFEVHPELADAVQTLIDTRVKAATDSVRVAIKEDIAPIQKHLATTESNNHLKKIESAHPDLQSILSTGDLTTWIESLPTIARTGAAYVYQFGNADEIISLINDYKAARNIQPQAKEVPVQEAPMSNTPDTEDIVKQVMSALSVRTNKEPVALDTKRRAPKEKTFDDAVAEYDKSRFRR